MQTLSPHHSDRHELSPPPQAPRAAGAETFLNLGFVSLVLAILAIAVSFFSPLALAALPMSLLALLAGLLDVKTTFHHRDARLGLALLACVLSLAAFVMAVDASSSVRRLSNESPLDTPRPWLQPVSPTRTP